MLANEGGISRDTPSADQETPTTSMTSCSRQPSRRCRKYPPNGYSTVAGLVQRGHDARSTIYDAIKRRELPASLYRGVLVVHDSDYADFLAVKPVDTKPEPPRHG
jgi:hypothetical protein